MNYELSGKTVIVTGSTKGIGRAIADAFAAEGVNLTIISRKQNDCDRVADEIKTKNPSCNVLPLAADISKMEDIDRIIQSTIDTFGTIDIMVNNAGAAITGPALGTSEADWDYVIDVDLKAVFFLCQKAGALMKEKGGGKIINVASIAGLVGQKGLVPYCAAKGGVIQLTKALALEWARYNIQINAVCPGYVRTPMNDEIIENEAIVKNITGRIPMRRFGLPEELADMCVFLATKGSNYMTGQAVCVDGGMVAE